MSLFRKQGRELTTDEWKELNGQEPNLAKRMYAKAISAISATEEKMYTDVLAGIDAAAKAGKVSASFSQWDALSKAEPVLLRLHDRLRAEGFEVEWTYDVLRASDFRVKWSQP
jgi:hypothetical protein